MKQRSPNFVGRWLAACVRAVVCMCAVGFVVVGCDDDADDESAMTMQGQPQPAGPATGPSTVPSDVTTRASEEAAPVYISVDGKPYEFPPAKLYLKRTGDRVRATLLSDDPPQAVERGYAGDSFYFEMDMTLPANASAGAGTSAVSAKDLAAAEWTFHNEATGHVDTPSGVFLDGTSHLQPVRVSVWFEPLDEQTVIVTLDGWFAEFDKDAPGQGAAKREVRVQAVIPAGAISR